MPGPGLSPTGYCIAGSVRDIGNGFAISTTESSFALFDIVYCTGVAASTVSTFKELAIVVWHQVAKMRPGCRSGDGAEHSTHLALYCSWKARASRSKKLL